MAEKKDSVQIMTEMNVAAEQAASEIETLKTAKDVAVWFKTNYMKAGYKRLAKALIAHFNL